MTPTPTWLYYLFGVLVLIVAAYGAGLLTRSLVTRSWLGWDVDVSHALMGVSMAGMFVTQWAFGPSAMWELIFSLLLGWFLVRSAQSLRRWGLHLTHFLIHAVMAFAMLLMYWFPMRTTSGTSMVSMSMSSSAGRLDPGLAFLLVVILFTSAVFTLASPYKGASHHGRHIPMSIMSGSPSPAVAGSTPAYGSARAKPFLRTPWLEDASHVVMCVAMGFMLILMI